VASEADRRPININDGARTASVEVGRPLLFGLMSSGIYVPSACGGRGSCGQCRVYVKGRLAHTDAERSLISDSDRQVGVHLSCQIRVTSGLSIEVPWKHFSARQYVARVAAIRDLTWEIKEVTLDVAEGLSFAAGQYIQLFLPGTESAPEPKYRAYSMASSPSSARRLTLIVRREPEGVVSPYVFDRLRQGEELAIRGPFGDFRIHESRREILFIAGGTGLAPIRSMLLEMAEKVRDGAQPARPPRKATLYFSARAKKDLFFMDELHSLEQVLPLRVVPALSDPEPDDSWDGETGGITAVLDRTLDKLERHEAYLCGSAGMIDASIKVLTSKGMSEERVFFDKFV